jgi:hypothetical protein
MATIRKAFSSKDAELELLGGRPLEFMINYSATREKNLNRSAGSNKPTSFSEGDETYECKLTLGMADLVAVENAAKKASLNSILDLPPFPIVISFINTDQVLVQDVVTATFQSTGRNVGENETIRYEHDMFVTGIEFNKSL